LHAASSFFYTGLSPSLLFFSKIISPLYFFCTKPHTTIHSKKMISTLHTVLLHSPLLKESLLLSFPPLNNMFKFSFQICTVESGFAYFLSDCLSARAQGSVAWSFACAKFKQPLWRLAVSATAGEMSFRIPEGFRQEALSYYPDG
jgi:hypothetical protein